LPLHSFTLAEGIFYAGANLQPPSQTAGAAGCAAACEGAPSCLIFSWLANGTCYLRRSIAVQPVNDRTAISGRPADLKVRGLGWEGQSARARRAAAP
jgi:hypothetical protein